MNKTFIFNTKSRRHGQFINILKMPKKKNAQGDLLFCVKQPQSSSWNHLEPFITDAITKTTLSEGAAAANKIGSSSPQIFIIILDNEVETQREVLSET